MLRIVKRQTIPALAQDLATVVTQQDDVFARLPIIVPSMAMGDWLIQYLAEKNGVSALTDCHFFGMMQWAWVEEVTGEKAFQPQAPLSMSGIHWRLFAWLYANGETILQHDGHPLHELLSILFAGKTEFEDSAVARLWTFSEQFARIFVRYMTLRPDWLDSWRKDEALDIAEMLANQANMPPWLARHYHQIHACQRFLWQLLFADIYHTRAQRIDHFWQLLRQQPDKIALLPPQIVVFTLQGITPDMLAFMVKLSDFVDITLHHFTPTYQMIDDIVDAKWLQRYQLEHINAQDAHFDAGHTLVSRFGKQARDQAKLLSQIDEQAQNGLLTLKVDDEDMPTQRDSLLGVLQQEIHALDNAAPSRDYFKRLYEGNQFAQDDSLTVHACHGLFRQLEVLRAQLVEWLNADSSRQLSDILIVLPEIGEEQALIRAVFPPDGRYDGLTLPARITGVIAADTMNLWAAISGYFTLLERRFNAREVMDWLLLAENANALGLSVDEMQRSVALLQDAGFKRGFDEAHLQESLATGDDDYRFCFTYALDRLVVGLLMPAVSDYHNSIPMAHITMADTHNINALTTAASIIQRIRVQQARGHDVYEWLDLIEGILRDYFAFVSHAQSYVVIQQSIVDLRYQLSAQDALMEQAERHPLPLAFVLNYIEKGLVDRQVSSEPSGVITIGRLSAMRGLPYKLIAFLNVNIDEFPSTGMDERYDLTTIDKRRPGDQIKEEDDLSAFLDLLLSAQEACWFFYDRYRPEDAQEHLPSNVLQELLDYLSAHCPDSQQAQYQFINEHPQNPFDIQSQTRNSVPLWQGIQRKLNQHKQSADATTHSAQPSANDWLTLAVPSFADVFTSTLSEASSESIALTQILYELTRPAQTFARAQGLAFLSDIETVEAYEPLSANNLTDYSVIDWFIQQQLQHKDIDFATVKRLPIVPAGAYGDLWLHKQHKEFQQRLQDLLDFANEPELTPICAQQIDLDWCNIGVDLPKPNHQGPWVMMSAGKGKHKHILRAWLHHLLWQIQRNQSNADHKNASQGDAINLNGSTIVQFKNQRMVLSPMDAALAQQHLKDWLCVWRYSRQHLWLAPIELLFSTFVATSEQDADMRMTNIGKKSRDWLAEGDNNYFYKLDHADIWAHLLQDYQAGVIVATISQFVACYVDRLIAPIYAHQGSENNNDQ